MTTNRTFTMIKPNAVASGHSGAILNMIEEAGFKIIALKMAKITNQRAGEFYGIHKGKPFFEDLCEYMSSGVIIAAILQKENAVADYRKLIGATDPTKAEEGTIRKKFAASMKMNAVHGADSDENAKIEGDFYFPGREIYW